MTTAQITKPEMGTLIHGTMRACDLADAYLGACDCYGIGLDLETVVLLQDAAAHASSTVAPDFHDETWDALSEAEEALSAIAPFGCYFGAHVGDGSDFGFWLTEEWIEALEERGISDDDWEAVLSICESEQIDSDDLCDAWQGEVSGYNEDQAGAEFAQQTAEECGMIDNSAKWPHTCINWVDAWRELSHDGYSLHQLGATRWAVIRAV